MLIIQRHPGDRLFLERPGMKITVTVLSASPSGKVKLGIDAPAEVTILRDDLEAKPTNGKSALSAEEGTFLFGVSGPPCGALAGQGDSAGASEGTGLASEAGKPPSAGGEAPVAPGSP